MNTSLFLGTWRLVSCVAHQAGGHSFFPYGETPSGLLIYAPDGMMCAMLVQRGRPAFASGDPTCATPGELRRAFLGMDAYFGTYHVDMARHMLIHEIEGARLPNMDGSQMALRFAVEEGYLALTLPSLYFAGTNWMVETTWIAAGAGSTANAWQNDGVEAAANTQYPALVLG